MATSDRDLDDLLAEARDIRLRPSDDLMARILADAGSVARERGPVRPAVAPRSAGPRRGWLAALAEAIGGWPAMGGLAASAVLGLVLGIAPPAGLSGFAPALWGEEVSVSLGLDDDPLSLLEG